MLDVRRCAAELQHLQVADDVGVDIGAWIFERVAYARLGAEMNDAAHLLPLQLRSQRARLCDVELVEGKSLAAGKPSEPRRLQRRIVIGVHAVDAHDGVTACEQALADMAADEAGGSGDEDGHARTSDAGRGGIIAGAGFSWHPPAGPAR